MTPEERAERLVLDEGITKSVGRKHESPGQAADLIAAAIRDAVAAERERAAKAAEGPVARWPGVAFAPPPAGSP